ncbi:hypothetical protein BJY01DRAFT_256605 [Aspergillus pseudoustus]|uniref:Major facilitator superfamily (MFS) profile domain-containing protein n=1 Tax=Aspergillus pseudoustus TaxID=1810923 RepID=A0ABR4I706_9EURO
MSMALFTDELLFSFMVPLLPYIFEQRIRVQESRVQAYTSIFLFEGALVAIITSPLIGHVADRAKSKKALLLGMLMLTLASVCGLALTTSCKYVHLTTIGIDYYPLTHILTGQVNSGGALYR